MARFEYLEAATVKEAVSLLERYGDEARAIAGGTDLVVQIRYRECPPKSMVNPNPISILCNVVEAGDGLEIHQVLGSTLPVSNLHHQVGASGYRPGLVPVPLQEGNRFLDSRRLQVFKSSHGEPPTRGRNCG